MKIEIPKVVEELRLAEYHGQFEGAGIWVWVNPGRDLLRVRDAMKLGKLSSEEIYGWFAVMWSQGPEGSQMSVEEVKALAGEALERDPQLWYWLTRRTSEMITAHRVKKKVSLR